MDVVSLDNSLIIKYFLNGFDCFEISRPDAIFSLSGAPLLPHYENTLMLQTDNLHILQGKHLLLLFFLIALHLTGCSSGGGGGDVGVEDSTAPITTVSPPGGNYATPQFVTLTANEPAIIYYTLDGTTPSAPCVRIVVASTE